MIGISAGCSALAAGVFAAAFTLLLGCSSESAAPAPSPTAPAACAAGEHASDAGTCAPAGLPPDLPCAPGEWQNDGGTCIPAGVPPDGCGAGFTFDGNGGCEPVLPAKACPPGQMAVPGDTSCHEVAPCGNGTWGSIPVDASTEHVDGSYAGGGSDGSAVKPWVTITQAVSAAAPGAIVAIAAGSYHESLSLTARKVRLWGRCPSMVELVSASVSAGTLLFEPKASGSEVHDLALTGSFDALWIFGAKNVLIDRIWVHDTAAGTYGIYMADDLGPTEVTIRRSLVERIGTLGAITAGAGSLTVDASVLRGIKQKTGQAAGISVQPGKTGVRGTVNVTGCVLENNPMTALLVDGSDATVERTVVRGTIPTSGSVPQGGITIGLDVKTKEIGKATIRTSVIEDNSVPGIDVFGGEAVVESTVVRRTQPEIQGAGGFGIYAQPAQPKGSSVFLASVDVRRSLVAQNHYAGFFIVGSNARIESTLVRETLPDVTGNGVGLLVRPVVPDAPATVTLTTSVVDKSTEGGVIILGATATLEGSVVRGTTSLTSFGEGLVLQNYCDEMGCDPMRRSSGTVHATRFDANLAAGIWVDTSDLVLDESVVTGTLATPGGFFGDGIAVLAGRATVTSTRIEGSARAGVSSFGGDVNLGASALACQPFDLDGETLMSEAYAFHDKGENGCGCPAAAGKCKQSSSMLAPPPPRSVTP